MHSTRSQERKRAQSVSVLSDSGRRAPRCGAAGSPVPPPGARCWPSTESTRWAGRGRRAAPHTRGHHSLREHLTQCNQNLTAPVINVLKNVNTVTVTYILCFALSARNPVYTLHSSASQYGPVMYQQRRRAQGCGAGRPPAGSLEAETSAATARGRNTVSGEVRIGRHFTWEPKTVERIRKCNDHRSHRLTTSKPRAPHTDQPTCQRRARWLRSPWTSGHGASPPGTRKMWSHQQPP